MPAYAKMILDLVNRPDHHYTAEGIFLELKKENPKIVLATVYNNLKSLCDQKLIRKVSVEGQPDRYDRIVRHDHLVCRRCGRLSDIKLSDLTESLRRQTGIIDLTYDLRINYLCPRCRAAQTGESSDGEA
ncbi:Fe2+/Zn2+ uptake regulation protein [Jonquetella anthropi DSM 22815]|uniref:Fe2+/Zn2+ uptake regulation protein n=1 Tax=Jonquetella anthropi DSM 22815 TaxID=885272 RepID=H0UJC0_9BACT|nr:transcriptional repressor [Jonquetella anthropi]EEX49099.1 transcriptional regulator, Fur family [Jonquetella anthropi E3_33 E1]EHM13887.1 Fe2+/Zn2+ uptake regulation protein [Jonquetella anthropi DSM 22815]